MNKPFDLEAFKAGQKAIHVNSFSKDTVSFLTVSSKGLIVFEYDDGVVTISTLKTMEDCYVMVSRHQHLIDSYDPEDTWQIKTNSGVWCDMGLDHLWTEERDYRLHPHNDLIKAYKKGAKIECKHKGVKWRDASSDDIRAWYEEAEYRIKQKPESTYPIYKQSKHSDVVVEFTDLTTGKVLVGNNFYEVGHVQRIWTPHTDAAQWQDWTPPTKTVYEWIHEANAGNVNYFVSSWVADEDVEYFFGLDAPKQKYKTGRSMEVEV